MIRVFRVFRGTSSLSVFALCLNLSAFVPVEIDAIAKLMKEPGLSDVMLKTEVRSRKSEVGKQK